MLARAQFRCKEAYYCVSRNGMGWGGSVRCHAAQCACAQVEQRLWGVIGSLVVTVGGWQHPPSGRHVPDAHTLNFGRLDRSRTAEAWGGIQNLATPRQGQLIWNRSRPATGHVRAQSVGLGAFGEPRQTQACRSMTLGQSHHSSTGVHGGGMGSRAGTCSLLCVFAGLSVPNPCTTLMNFTTRLGVLVRVRQPLVNGDCATPGLERRVVWVAMRGIWCCLWGSTDSNSVRILPRVTHG